MFAHLLGNSIYLPLSLSVRLFCQSQFFLYVALSDFFLQLGPASHLHNTVQPIELYLQFSPLHSEISHPQCIISRILSGASFVPGGTG